MSEPGPAGIPAAAAQGRAPLGQWALGGVFLIAYLALEWLSFIHEYKGVPVTPWNPGLGVVFALMISAGKRYAVVLFAGALIAELIVLRTQLEWPIIVGIAVVIAGGYGGVAEAVRGQIDLNLPHLRDTLGLLLGGVIGATVVALFLSALLLADARIDFADLLVATGPLWLGDIIGIAVMTPLTLRLVLRGRPSDILLFVRSGWELLIFTAVVLALLWAILSASGIDSFRLFYVLFLPVIVIAVRHGFDGACIGLAVTQLGLVALLHLYDYDAAAFTEFQLRMLVLTATALTVGVVVSERQQSDRRAQEIALLLRRKEADAAEAARYNLVSGMAAAVAHEINQPMTAARALARSAQQLIGMPQPDLPRAANNLATMIEQIDHVGAVVRRMREFLRRGRPHVSTIDVASMVEDTLLLVRADAAMRETRIESDIPDSLPPIHADRVQIQQVLLNLVRNAIDAIRSAGITGGTVHITAHHVSSPARVEFSVRDNGPGIAPDLAERLFEPLTTSKQDGLGLGLSISASIIESHGGKLWLAQSTPGATEFRFFLPLDSVST